jgi:hypothetical protein
VRDLVCHKLLSDARLYVLLSKFDEDLAAKTKRGRCGGRARPWPRTRAAGRFAPAGRPGTSSGGIAGAGAAGGFARITELGDLSGVLLSPHNRRPLRARVDVATQILDRGWADAATVASE